MKEIFLATLYGEIKMKIRVLSYKNIMLFINFVKNTMIGSPDEKTLKIIKEMSKQLPCEYEASCLLWEINKFSYEFKVECEVIEDEQEEEYIDPFKKKKEEIHKLIDENKYEDAILAIVRYIQYSSVPRG